jgi:predicted peptidase
MVVIGRSRKWIFSGIVFLASLFSFAEASVAASPGPPKLTDLKVKVTTGGGTAIAPDFSPDIVEYSLAVQSDIDTIRIIPIINSRSKAKLTVNGRASRPGAVSIVRIAVGNNDIPLRLAGADGASTLYLIHVRRENIQPVADSFLKLSFADPATNLTINYRLFVPKGCDPTKPYPLVLFLHGAFDMGSDNDRQLYGSQGATIWAKPDEQAKHPAFVLAPQCPHDPTVSEIAFAKGRWGRWGWTSLMSSGLSAPFAPQPQLKAAYDLLEHVLATYNIDRHRIYCTGLSMGAFATWDIALAHPDTFAALVPMAGGGDPNKLSILAKTPVWVFHAVKDRGIPVSFAANTLVAMLAAGGNPKYTEYPSEYYFYPNEHYAWVPAYADAEMREWLFRQSR